MVPNKKELFSKCLQLVDEKIEKFQAEMDNIKESMEANDVHTDYDEEGSKGELLGDFEKYATYLDNAQKMKQTLSTVDREHYSEYIKFGSVIETKNNFYFIAGPIGNLKMEDGRIVHVISTEAPIFEKLKGKKAGDTFLLNDEEVEILEVH
ncbi:transcription elongation factor [Gillisia sp. M10.2A]|uniref:Transcription elongation factor n=1 Tax=Gillisia lutea TaxID=2909668 RepID=A0ABS9EFP6_9FLAO|nr:transcription elongation factor [Gillisia lutea]MCF4101691.1 transcription elongation factor [Gillisia lutea]